MHLRRPLVIAVVGCCTAVACAGCTGSSSAGAAAATFDPRPADLSCGDAGSGSAPSGPGDLTIAGLTLEGLSGQVSDVPQATRAGLAMPLGSDLRFRKAPAHLPAGAGPVTVEIAAPAGSQALAWVPAAEWTGGGRPDLRPWLTRRVTFDGCPDRDVTYFGGVLAGRPDACLHLRIRPARAQARELTLRLDGTPC